MGRAHSTYVGKDGYGKYERKSPLRKLSVDGKIILKKYIYHIF
jgi:hypothetical protein